MKEAKFVRKIGLFVLGFMMVLCLSGLSIIQAEAAARTTKKKAAYSVKYCTEVYDGHPVNAVFRYELPQLKGNSKIVKKINKSLKKDYKER